MYVREDAIVVGPAVLHAAPLPPDVLLLFETLIQEVHLQLETVLAHILVVCF
jgi:hypothetical protein